MTSSPTSRPRRRTVARVVLLLLLLLPAAYTLGDAPTGETRLVGDALRRVLPRVSPLEASQLGRQRVEFVLNVVLFLPIGVALPVALPRAPLTGLLLLGTAGSLAVEVAQRLVVQARTPDVVDVVANATGVAVGLLLGADLERRLSRRARPDVP